MSSTTNTNRRESASAMFGNMESQQLSHDSDDDVELQVELDANYQYIVIENFKRECLGLPIKKKLIGDTPADERKYKNAKREMGIPEPAVIGDVTERTMDGLPQELRDEITKNYLMKRNVKCSHLYVEANEMEEVLNDDGSVARLQHRDVPKIDASLEAAVAVCPEESKDMLRKALLNVAKAVAQKSTSGLEGEDLVRVENENADKMRVMKYTVHYVSKIEKVAQATHIAKQFPKICAKFNDGKDENELANKYEEYIMEVEDLREIDEKIEKSSGARETREKNNRVDKLKEIKKLKAVIEAKVYNIVVKKQTNVDDLKATIEEIIKTKEGREDFEINDDYYFPSAEVIEARLPVNRFTSGRFSSRSNTPNRSVTPNRNLNGKRNRDDENPRTSKKFPLNSPPNKKHRLSEYFKDVSSDLMFKVGKNGFEQSGGDWNNSKFAERLQALHDEVTA